MDGHVRGMDMKFLAKRGVDMDTIFLGMGFFEDRGTDMLMDTKIFEIVAWTWCPPYSGPYVEGKIFKILNFIIYL